jgi:hypothetical protein
MKCLNVLVLLFVGIFTVVGPNAYASTPETLIWWELETAAAADDDQGGMAAFLNRKKRLVLHRGKFSPMETGRSISGSSVSAVETDVWIRTPDGVVKKANLPAGADAVALDLPLDLDPGNLSGRYLVAAHLDAGTMDIDSDGKEEKVHLYSKYLVNFSKQDGSKGNNPDTFFRESDKLPLEIGPSLTNSIFKSAGCPHKNVLKGKATVSSYVSDGGTQRPFQDYRINVLFRGKPLANAEVLVLSKSGWRKRVMTDAEGALSFTPPNTLERFPESEKSEGTHGMPRHAMGKADNGDRTGTTDGNDRTAARAMHSGMHGDVTTAGQFRAGKDEPEKTKGMPAHIRRKMQAAEDKLIYTVAYKDPSSGEYHCATLPMSLKEYVITDADISGKAGGFTLWGIMGTGLCCVGFGGTVYHRKKRNRDTILRSKKE